MLWVLGMNLRYDNASTHKARTIESWLDRNNTPLADWAVLTRFESY